MEAQLASAEEERKGEGARVGAEGAKFKWHPLLHVVI